MPGEHVKTPDQSRGFNHIFDHRLKLSPKSRSIRIRNIKKISLFFLSNPPDIGEPSFPERIASLYVILI
jgi:uncharacterized protein YjbK